MKLFMTSKLDRFLNRTYFPETPDLLFEEKKLNIARILIGVAIFWRTAKVAFAANFYFPADTNFLGFNFSSEVAFALIECALALLLTAGVFTPLVLASILITYPFFDKTLSISTLGTSVMLFFLFGLFMINFRSRYSLDAWVENRENKSVLKRALQRVYQILGNPDSKRIRRIYFLCFVCYATISLGAMLHHINDPHWIGGHTVSALLTNSYLCPHYAFFQSIEASWPTAFFLFSASGIIAQTFFQFAMIPCLFSRWGTVFVVLQGLVFFLVSAICISLSYLPFVELVLWGVIFWSSSLHSRAFAKRKATLPPAPQPLAVECKTHGLLIHETYLRLSAMTLLLLIANFPFLEDYTAHLKLSKPWIKDRLKHAGLEIPIVFNKTDLAMGNRWTIIYRNTDGVRTLVPFHDTDGARLWYLKSDILYFSNSLAWRRRCIEMPVEEMLDPDSRVVDLLQRTVNFDAKLFPPSENTIYEVFIRENNANAYSLPLQERLTEKQIGKLVFARAPDNADQHFVVASDPNSQRLPTYAESPASPNKRR